MSSWTGCTSTSDANAWNRCTNMSFETALGLYLSAFESFPFTLHVILCLAPIEVAHDGGHSCAMEQDRDQHNERQCAPKEVGRFESTLLERVGQVVHGTQPPNAVEADHSSLRRWANGHPQGRSSRIAAEQQTRPKVQT